MKLQLVLVLLMGASCFGAKSRYDNYKLFSLTLENVEQVKLFQNLERDSDSYDFWSTPDLGRDLDILVPPSKFGDFEDTLTRYNIKYYIKNENIQNAIDQEEREMNDARAARNASIQHNWNGFFTYAEINAWLDGRIAAYPNVLNNVIIGQSFEGRPLRLIRYSARAGNPAIFIEANIHAREWTSSATATYLINELTSSTDPTIREIANSIDWYIIPIANPDGFVFTHTTTRLWRKSRSPNAGSTCIGTDPNRNFDFFWMTGGASNNPCSDTYAGARPFSDPETAAIRDFYGTIASRTRIFLSFHAFGQYLLWPYGHTNAASTNEANLRSVGQATANAVTGTHNRDYVIGPSGSTLYVTSGSSVDWAFGVWNTRLAYTFELRERRGASNGFVLPPAQLIPNCEEVVNGLKAMVAQARAVGQL